jgi:hypothetical protein
MKDSHILFHKLNFIRTGPTSLQLAAFALKDVTMWPAQCFQSSIARSDSVVLITNFLLMPSYVPKHACSSLSPRSRMPR